MNEKFQDWDGNEAPSTIKPENLVAQFLLQNTGWDGNPASLNLKDYQSLMNIRMAIQNLNPKTPAAAVEKAKVMKIVADAFYEIENGRMLREHVPYATDRDRHTNQPIYRKKRIAALESALASDVFSRPLKIQGELPNPLIARMLIDDETGKGARVLISKLMKQIVEYELDYAKSQPRLHPESRKNEILIEISRGGLPLEQLQVLQAELIEVESSSAPLIARAETTRLIAAYQQIKENLSMLTEMLVAGLGKHRETAIKLENKLFSQFNLPSERTSITRKYDALINELEADIARRNKFEPRVQLHVPLPNLTSLCGIDIPGLT